MSRAQWHREPRILFIDDEQANVRLVERLLARQGYRDVTSTTDPRMAVPLMQSVAPDLVLLDLHMPGVDGFAVLEALRHAAAGDDYVPVVVLTGDGAVEAKRRALALGATDFIAKPFDLDEIALRIRNLLQTRLLHLALQHEKRAVESALARRTWELEEARIETLERLALAAEVRDDDTGQHTRRVGQLSGVLATALGLPATAVELIRRAAPLHDIGKIGIPDRVLLKPGPLSAEERGIMQTHTVIGARILGGAQSELLRTAADIAQHHHERWDGAGYPAGVAGADIPISARIVAVVDVFDALTHDRPYRPAWSVERTLDEILQGSGTAFDPQVVAAFRALDPMALMEPPVAAGHA
ncbi:MAG TPA: HD domain-containing phosphohydrolase [Gemmatimonadaceae bacterium]|nr:HD domain-containing phosphohydrolase [Gemmatimonadaceae bacterium]